MVGGSVHETLHRIPPGSTPPQGTCGNGTCELGESPSSCPTDCHRDDDGSCELPETQYVCPHDCGAVAITTGPSGPPPDDRDPDAAQALLA